MTTAGVFTTPRCYFLLVWGEIPRICSILVQDEFVRWRSCVGYINSSTLFN